jgi:hypothetical protein
MKFQIAKKDKREIIEDFLQHLDNLGVVFAEEVEDEKKGTVDLDPFTGIKDAVNTFLAGEKKNDEESE